MYTCSLLTIYVKSYEQHNLVTESHIMFMTEDDLTALHVYGKIKSI